MTAAGPLLVDVNDGVAVLTLNRPEKLNALSPDMIAQSIAAIERYANDPEVGCIVVTGAGRGFCAGGDVSAMDARPPAARCRSNGASIGSATRSVCPDCYMRSRDWSGVSGLVSLAVHGAESLRSGSEGMTSATGLANVDRKGVST